MHKIEEILTKKNTKGLRGSLDNPQLYSNSFLAVRSTETVNSPGELIQQLFRETFFEKISGSSSKSILNPLAVKGDQTPFFDEKEKLALYTFRERLIKNKYHSYLPAYPTLARNSWFRDSAANLFSLQYFGGPISQAIEQLNPDWKKRVKTAKMYATDCCDSLAGTNNDDIMKLLVLENQGILEKNQTINRIKASILGEDDDLGHKSEKVKNYHFPADYIDLDTLPSQILDDSYAIFKIEGTIPRIEWLDLLSTYFMLVIPIWVMAQSRFTIMLNDVVQDLMTSDNLPDKDSFYSALAQRNQQLFICSETPNDGGKDLLSKYSKSRIELGILFYALEHLNPELFKGKYLDLKATSGDTLDVYDDILINIKNNREMLFQILGSNSSTFKTRLKRIAENYGAWRSPTKVFGVARNMDFLLNGLRKMTNTQVDAGALLIPFKESNTITGYKVFPQQKIIKLFAYLSQEKNGRENVCTFRHLLDHFALYGIDIKSSDLPNAELMDQLLQQGMLRSSKDAGLNAQLYKIY